MMDLIVEYGPWVVGILGGGFGLFKIPFTRKILIVAIRSFLSREVFKEIILEWAGKRVKSTKTQIDDKWFNEFKKNIDDLFK